MPTISEKLTQVLENQAKDSVRFANYEKAQTEVHETLYGKDGVVIETDRTRVFKTQAKWFFCAIFLTILGVIGRWFYFAFLTEV